MAIELLSALAVRKPWGNTDLRPWSDISCDGEPTGELWFERADADATEPQLQLKLLLTTGPLSIQVHPDDEFAKSIGLTHGKTEAWYVLSATPDAKIAVGLRRRLTTLQLRSAIEDGSVSELIAWRRVRTDDVICVPAGTIHAIGAGLVIAEIQQRSDATFRLFDYGRKRELHVDNAVAAATPGPAKRQTGPVHFSDARSLLVVDPHFVLERLDLAPRSSWAFDAERETWLFVVRGNARIGLLNVSMSSAILAGGGATRIDVGPNGLRALVAYPGPAVAPFMLRCLDQPHSDTTVGLRAPSLLQSKGKMYDTRTEIHE
jgi:mannose-6-phosphate isomerase